MEGWEKIIGEVSLVALQIIAALVAIVVPVLLSKLLGYFKLKSNAELEALLTTVVKKAINYAEAWAKKQAAKPAGEEKLQIAIAFVIKIAQEYKLPKIAEAKIIELIEGQLARNEGEKNVESNTGGTGQPVGEGSGGSDQPSA